MKSTETLQLGAAPKLQCAEVRTALETGEVGYRPAGHEHDIREVCASVERVEVGEPPAGGSLEGGEVWNVLESRLPKVGDGVSTQLNPGELRTRLQRADVGHRATSVEDRRLEAPQCRRALKSARA